MRLPLVVLFLVILTLPLGINLTGRDGADAEAENRELAPFSWRHIDAWFEDHFGLRSTLVRWYGETRVFLLDMSPTPSVVKGREGFYYYADDQAIEDYVSESPLTAQALANWREALVRARQWLEARGIAYVFLVAPDKHVVYPEYMPASIRRIGPVSRTDQFYRSMEDLRFLVDVRPPLLQAKAGERVFQKTDTHWNDRGAFVAYTAIIEAVRAQVPAVLPPWPRADFDAVARETQGKDLAGMMGLKRVLNEEDLLLVPRRTRQARVVEPSGAEPIAEEGRLVTEIPGSSLPRAVIFRDSFTSRLVPFLSQHFSRAVYLWQNDFDAAAVQSEHPDVVVQEIVGRHLYNFIPSPELVPTR
jgi:alginate O-acetyltransferase complex protein AlgJ